MPKTQTIDYTKTCWYCHQGTMVPIETWYQCSKCGATYVEPPADGEFLNIAPTHDYSTGGASGTPIMRQRFPKIRARQVRKPSLRKGGRL